MNQANVGSADVSVKGPDIASGSQLAFLVWVQALMLTPITLRGESANLLTHIFEKIQKAVPNNLAVWWGFTSEGGRRPQAKIPPVEVWFPSSTAKRGRLTDPRLSIAEQKAMDPTKIPGPMVTSGETLIFLSPRLGAGLTPEQARFDVAVALVHGLLLAARGEPEANTRGVMSFYSGTFKTDAMAIGFDMSVARKYFTPTDGLRHILEDVLATIGNLPQGIIAAEVGYAKAGTPGLKTVCPWDLSAERKEAAIAAISGGGDKIVKAIKAGTIHCIARMTGVYNIADALPYCHRPHVKVDGNGKHPKDVGPLQMVMLTPMGNAIPIGEDVPSFLAKEAEAKETADAALVETLQATGTDGMPLSSAPILPAVAPANPPNAITARTVQTVVAGRGASTRKK